MLDTVPSAAAPLDSSNLTGSQHLIWVGQQRHPEAGLYDMALAFTIEGPIDAAAFVRAWTATVADCDALRTVILVDAGGVPQQYVGDDAPAATTVAQADVSGAADPAAAADAWMAGRLARRFALDRCLVDCGLLRLGPDRWVWYFAQHHLIADGMAFAVVYERMAAHYAREAAGGPAPPPLPRYADYVAFERARRAHPATRAAAGYWDTLLATPLAPLTLFDAAPAPSTRTDRVVVRFGDERTARLAALAATPRFASLGPDLTAFALFAALFAAWLGRLSGPGRLGIAAPLHNRPTPAFRRTAGLFIEIAPLAIEIDAGDTFTTLHGKVLAQALQALRHSLPGTTTAARNVAAPALLNFVTARFGPFGGHPVRARWLHAGYGDPHHQVRLQIADFDGTGWALHFDFNRGAFTAAQQQLAVRHFLEVADAALAAPARRLRDVPLQWPGEAARRAAVNATDTRLPAGETVATLLRAQWARTPEAVAIVDGLRTMTYAGLQARAHDLAGALQAHGAGPGVLVGVLARHDLDTVAAIAGVLAAGAAFVPLEAGLPPARLRAMLARIAETTGRPPLIVADGPLPAPAIDAGALHVPAAGLSGAAGTAGPRLADAAPHDLAYCLFTSGSTGEPKGVLIEHASLVNYLRWAERAYTPDRPASMPLFTALGVDLTLTSLLLPLVTGGRVLVYGDSGGPQALAILAALDDPRADLVKCTPSHLALARGRTFGPEGARTLIVGGEDLRTDLARAIVQGLGRPVTLVNEYGPTEATVGCAAHRFDPSLDRWPSVPIGTPIANARMDVVDRLGEPAPTGVTGQILVRGAGVARGYLGLPALTAERFVPAAAPGGPAYVTGDLGRWTEDGRLEFLGRADRQVKLGGLRVELGDVEAALLAVPGVTACAVELVTPPATRAALRCVRCGLADDMPGVAFDADGVCDLCRRFEGYRDKAHAYFRPMDAFGAVAARMRAGARDGLDAVVLFSGGKDSSYMLGRLVDLGVRPLAFTLDNGYLSTAAIDNIQRVTAALGVPHVFGGTEAMAGIFAESLRTHANVCNGCFKTIYTLAVQLARERGLRFIVTGLSRGQFFETRLTESLFTGDVAPDDIDRLVLEARRAYHRREDAVSRALDADVFRGVHEFEDVEFVDFYRYCDVGLDELYAYLRDRLPWIRPGDTGRSTNCLINDVGILVHRRTRGFHNYALPYSWDVRLGHKTREAAVAELEDEIDEGRVRTILREIGYGDLPPAADAQPRLVAFVAARPEIDDGAIRAGLADRLPPALVPSTIVTLDALPLLSSGKIDRRELVARLPDAGTTVPAAAPGTEAERRVSEIVGRVLGGRAPGVRDSFFTAGGTSLLALRLTAQLVEAFGVMLPADTVFATPTIAGLAARIETELLADIDALSESDAQQLLEGGA